MGQPGPPPGPQGWAPQGQQGPPASNRSNSNTLLIIIGLLLVVVVVGGIVLLAGGDDDDDGAVAGGAGGDAPTDQTAPEATEGSQAEAPSGAPTPDDGDASDQGELGPPTPAPADQTADPRAAEGCFDGEMASCDFMSTASHAGTASYGATCGGRLTVEIPGECAARYGSMVD